MKVLQKNVLCRVGRDHHSGALFIGKLRGLDEEIAKKVCEQLNISPEELHNITCLITENTARSISGDNYLSEKVLELELVIVVGRCKLIDDQEER